MKTQDQEWVDEKRASDISKKALPTLRNDRHHNRGIRFYKIGRSVRYKVSDIIEFMEARKVSTVDQD